VRVQFWGTRGSIAKPGPSTARYGGNDHGPLAIVEHEPPRSDGMEICRAIREHENDREHQLAEECADKQGEPPIRHAGELCSYDAAARQRAAISKSATACDFALRLMRGCLPDFAGRSSRDRCICQERTLR
jgi:hypothetical protein